MLAWMCLHSFSGEFSLVLSLMGLIVNVYTYKIGVNLDSYSKGEFGLGQHELNVKYAEILEMADRHVVYKQVCIICFHF
jgi:glutamine synthetase